MKRVEALQRIEIKLRERRSELLGSAESDFNELRNQFGDQAWEDGREETDLENDELISALAEHASDELRQIDHALRQLREGRYGCCEECDRSIPIARLEALPFATTCVVCQQQLEDTGSATHNMHAVRRAWPNNDARRVEVLARYSRPFMSSF